MQIYSFYRVSDSGDPVIKQTVSRVMRKRAVSFGSEDPDQQVHLCSRNKAFAVRLHSLSALCNISTNREGPDQTVRCACAIWSVHWLFVFDVMTFCVCNIALMKMWALSDKTYLPTYAANEDSNQRAHPRSLISLRCPHEETLHSWLSKMRPVEILIRLREGAGWSESSLGAHVRKYVLWRWGSCIHGNCLYSICLMILSVRRPH